MSRRLSGEASPAEIQELQDLLDQSPEKGQLLDILQSWFTAHNAGQAADTAAGLDAKFNRIIRHPAAKAPQSPAPRPLYIRLRRAMSYAAALAVLTILAWSIFRRHQPTTRPPAPNLPRGGEVVAKPGVRTKLLLPDGTQVWLNSNSKLKYAADFDLHSREVELDGEAYFDVVRDMQHPFIVHTSAIDIRVLGTAFTVKSYAQDETIEATLLRGAIEISGRDNPNAPRIILKPDEKLVLNRHLFNSPRANPPSPGNAAGAPPARPDISVNPVPAHIPDSAKEETAWLYNRLVFNGDTFKELAEKMERWYDVRIIFQDQDLYKYRFAGAFANESIQEALNALQLTASFSYKIKGDVIELYKK